MGPGLPRTAEPERAQPSGTTTGSTSASGSSTSTSTPASPASTPPTCAAGSAGTGLYTQRRPGIPGGKTATLEPEELEDELFMLRIRIDGGALTSEQLRVVADIGNDIRPGPRRRHRPAERAAALDPHRGRAGDLALARGGRAVHDRGVRRHAAGHARLPARRGGRRLGARRERRAARDRRCVRRRPRVLQPAAQVQDVDLRLRAALHEPRDQRRLLRRRHRPGRRRPASTSGSAAGSRPTR